MIYSQGQVVHIYIVGRSAMADSNRARDDAVNNWLINERCAVNAVFPMPSHRPIAAHADHLLDIDPVNALSLELGQFTFKYRQRL